MQLKAVLFRIHPGKHWRVRWMDQLTALNLRPEFKDVGHCKTVTDNLQNRQRSQSNPLARQTRRRSHAHFLPYMF